jgi:hypothetical protein
MIGLCKRRQPKFHNVNVQTDDISPVPGPQDGPGSEREPVIWIKLKPIAMTRVIGAKRITSKRDIVPAGRDHAGNTSLNGESGDGQD